MAIKIPKIITHTPEVRRIISEGVRSEERNPDGSLKYLIYTQGDETIRLKYYWNADGSFNRIGEWEKV